LGASIKILEASFDDHNVFKNSGDFVFSFPDIAEFLRESVKMDGVSLEELNLMLEMAKGLETSSSNDLVLML
jgi:hypothetical protein